jgi:aryl-alcohol dehydrogenase-like predicted oxidoreductase
MALAKRRLGGSGLEIAPLVFGGNVFGWTADEPTSHALLDAFVDAGFDAIDTADSYSRWVPGHQGGESETVIGNWLERRGGRDRLIIATKVGSDMGQGHNDLSAAHIARSVEGSLKRLKTDYIDLYQSHWDVEAVPFEEVLGAYARLIEQGKVRAIGCSNLSASRLRQALKVSADHGLPRYETVQPKYNLVDRDSFEGELEDLCLQEGLGVISYYGLAAGFLTGKYRSEADLGKSPRGQGAAKYLNERGLGVLKVQDEVAAVHGATPAQVALAWLMAKPAVTAPIASATSVAQLQDIMQAARLDLSAAEMAALDAAGA